MSVARTAAIASMIVIALAGCPAGSEGGGAATNDAEGTATTGCVAAACESTGPAVDSGSGSDADSSSDADSGSDTGQPTPEESSACLHALAWRDQLLAVSSRTVPGEAHEALQATVLIVDPDTGERTELFTGGSGTSEIGTRFEALAPTEDGGVVVGGANFGFAGDGPALLQKYAADGSFVWESPLTSFQVLDVALRGDDVLAVDALGTASYVVVSEVDGSFVAEVAAEGQSTHVEVAQDGAVYVAGKHADVPSTYLRRHAADDQLQWEQAQTATPGFTTEIQGLAVDADGGGIVAVRDMSEDGSIVDIVFRKYDADGNVQWTVPYDDHVEGGAPNGVVDVIGARPGGGFVAVGRIAIGDGAAFAFAYDGDGNLLWSELREDTGLTPLHNTALAVTPRAVYVAGCSMGGTEHWLDTLAP